MKSEYPGDVFSSQPSIYSCSWFSCKNSPISLNLDWISFMPQAPRTTSSFSSSLYGFLFSSCASLHEIFCFLDTSSKREVHLTMRFDLLRRRKEDVLCWGCSIFESVLPFLCCDTFQSGTIEGHHPSKC